MRFARSFQTDSIPTFAQLRFAPVSANLRISIDGQVVASAEPYDPIQTVEIERPLNPGSHVINVDARGVEGPSAFFLQLDLQYEDQTHAVDHFGRIVGCVRRGGGEGSRQDR